MVTSNEPGESCADEPLTTKEGWRRFVDRVPAAPDQHNPATAELLTEAQRITYDEERLAYYADLPLANTPTVQKVISTVRLLVQLNRSLVGMDEYLYRRTGGMIGSLSQLIRGGAILAIENRSEAVTRDLLDIVPVDYAAERADVARTGAGRVKRAAS